MRMKIRSPTKDKRESFTTEYGTDKPGAFQYGSFLSEGQRKGRLSFYISKERKEKLSPKESDKTAEPLGTRVFTVRRRFCRYCLSPTKQITTKLVFVVSDHYGFVVISVFCRLYLQLTELRESRHEPLSTSLCLIEKIKKQMDGFRGPPQRPPRPLPTRS